MELKTHKNKSLTIHALANPDLQHNLLSVQDMARRYGLVAFTSQYGYILDMHTDTPTVMSKAPWRTNHYALNAKVAPPVKIPNAKAARTAPVPNRTKHNKISQIQAAQAPQKPQKPEKTNPPPPNSIPTPRCTIRKLRTLSNPPTHKHQTKAQLSTHNWHLRLNHANPSKPALTAQKRLILLMPTQLPSKLPLTCSACDNAKLHPAPHKPKNHDYAVGEYVSSDTCGPPNPTSAHGNNHMPWYAQ